MPDTVLYNDQELRDYLKRAGATFLEGTPAYRDILEKAGRKVGAKAEEVVGEYPPQPNRPLNAYYPRTRVADGTPYLSKFKTSKQQGYFFANLADGGIGVPYKRTGFLGASIASEVTVVESGVLVEVGTPLGYAPLVIGDPETEQSYYHAQSGWEPLTEQMEDGLSTFLGVFADEVVDGVEDYLKG